jgi:hypothetical protein
MKKIIVRIVGNQLFCYAAARRLAIVNNAELIIDSVSFFTYDYKYKRSYQPFEMRAFIKEERIDFDPRFLNIRASGKMYLKSYRQSENYFKDVEDQIKW